MHRHKAKAVSAPRLFFYSKENRFKDFLFDASSLCIEMKSDTVDSAFDTVALCSHPSACECGELIC